MNFQTSIQTCFKKYTQFSGRASRSEFWFFALFGLIGGLITAVIDTMILGYPLEDYGPTNIIFQIVKRKKEIIEVSDGKINISFSTERYLFEAA